MIGTQEVTTIKHVVSTISHVVTGFSFGEIVSFRDQVSDDGVSFVKSSQINFKTWVFSTKKRGFGSDCWGFFFSDGFFFFFWFWFRFIFRSGRSSWGG